MTLSGTEVLWVVPVDADGGLSPIQEQTTTSAIAALASLETSNTVVTALTSVGAGTITAVGIVGGIVKRGGAQSGSAFTDTTAIATAIIAALPAGAGIGSSWEFRYINNTDAVATIAHGTGVTISSGLSATATVTVPANGYATFLVAYSAAGAVTMVQIESGSYAASATDTTKVLGYSLAGQTTATTALIATQNTSNAVYTLPVATDTLAGLATANAFTGNNTATGTYTGTATFTTTNPATTREIYGKVLFTYSGTVTVGSGGTGSVAGVRGEVSGNSGTTLKDGFYFGAQGKFILNGSTIQETSAARYTGVMAQLDLSSGTMTSGQLSALWADMGATAAGAFTPETYIIRATNTTSQTVTALYQGYGKATYAFDINGNGSSLVLTAGASTAGSSTHCAANRVLYGIFDGTPGYIPIFNSNS